MRPLRVLVRRGGKPRGARNGSLSDRGGCSTPIRLVHTAHLVHAARTSGRGRTTSYTTPPNPDACGSLSARIVRDQNLFRPVRPESGWHAPCLSWKARTPRRNDGTDCRRKMVEEVEALDDGHRHAPPGGPCSEASGITQSNEQPTGVRSREPRVIGVIPEAPGSFERLLPTLPSDRLRPAVAAGTRTPPGKGAGRGLADLC